MTNQTRITAPGGHNPGLCPTANRATNAALEALLCRQDIWRGRNATLAAEVISSGYPELDQRLQGGGWPMGGLIDIAQANNGHGEWQLLSPALAQLSRQAGLIMLVNPPAMPYAPGLAQLGIDYRAIKVVRSRHKEALLSALVEALQARCCLALLAWEGRFNWRYAELRKLQLAASQSHCLSICLRRDRPGRVQSPALLRLRSQLSHQGLQVQLLKQRGQYQPGLCTLPLPSLWAPEHSQLGHQWSQASHQHGLAKVLNFQRPGLNTSAIKQEG